MSTLHCALENGADLYVNERQKLRHYRARSTEERRKKKNAKSLFFTLQLIQLEISHRTRWRCLKCVIVYLARVSPAFVMYCVYGASHSSLLIES